MWSMDLHRYTHLHSSRKRSKNGNLWIEHAKSNAQNSLSEMDYSNDIDKGSHERFVSATIHVVDATNLTSSVLIRGFQGIRIDGLSLLGRVKPRSFAFICTHGNGKWMKKPLIHWGKRLSDDFLVRFQSEHSIDGKLRFNFHDPLIKLNYISVTVNVGTFYIKSSTVGYRY